MEATALEDTFLELLTILLEELAAATFDTALDELTMALEAISAILGGGHSGQTHTHTVNNNRGGAEGFNKTRSGHTRTDCQLRPPRTLKTEPQR